MPKEGCCEILKSIRTLIKHQRLEKLSKLVLSANNLQPIEDEVGELLNTCLTEHKHKLTLFLSGDQFSKQFVNHWEEICAETHLTPVFGDVPPLREVSETRRSHQLVKFLQNLLKRR